MNAAYNLRESFISELFQTITALNPAFSARGKVRLSSRHGRQAHFLNRPNSSSFFRWDTSSVILLAMIRMPPLPFE